MRSRCVSSPYQITTVYGNVEGYPLNNGFHTGVDYVSDGRILSPMDSVVSATGYDSENGNYLVLEANGYRDWFSHIKTDGYLVSKGQTVKRGQHIAYQGRTGSASGVHVHHSLRVNGVMVDPEKHISIGDIMDETAGTELYWSGFHRAPESKSVAKQWNGKTVTEALRNVRTKEEWLKQNHILKVAYPEAIKIISIKDNEIARLKAELATNDDSVQLNALGVALRWLVKRLGLKG